MTISPFCNGWWGGRTGGEVCKVFCCARSIDDARRGLRRVLLARFCSGKLGLLLSCSSGLPIISYFLLRLRDTRAAEREKGGEPAVRVGAAASDISLPVAFALTLDANIKPDTMYRSLLSLGLLASPAFAFVNTAPLVAWSSSS